MAKATDSYTPGSLKVASSNHPKCTSFSPQRPTQTTRPERHGHKRHDTDDTTRHDKLTHRTKANNGRGHWGSTKGGGWGYSGGGKGAKRAIRIARDLDATEVGGLGLPVVPDRSLSSGVLFLGWESWAFSSTEKRPPRATGQPVAQRIRIIDRGSRAPGLPSRAENLGPSSTGETCLDSRLGLELPGYSFAVVQGLARGCGGHGRKNFFYLWSNL